VSLIINRKQLPLFQRKHQLLQPKRQVAAQSPGVVIEEAVVHGRLQLLFKMQSLPLKVKEVCAG
jgi:hypothetical protein